MKVIVKIVYILSSLFFLLYLLLPTPKFPDPLTNSLRSKEPADTESDLRRAYFTSMTRQEVINHYQVQMRKTSFLRIPIPTYRLNYPPEEAKTIIRDQTRSTFLEEIVHPFRESVFISGFEPKEEKDAIFIDERHWRQKIIVRFVPSSLIVRSVLGLATTILIYLVCKVLASSFSSFANQIRKIWISR